MTFPGDELGPDARALLDATRGGDDPSPADAERVRRKLAARLALGAAAGVTAATVTKSAGGATAASAGGASVAGAAAGTSSMLGVKVLLAVALVGGATATTAVVRHDRATRVVTSPAVTATPTTSISAPAQEQARAEERTVVQAAPAPLVVEPARAEPPPTEPRSTEREVIHESASTSTVTTATPARAVTSHPVPSHPVTSHPVTSPATTPVTSRATPAVTTPAVTTPAITTPASASPPAAANPPPVESSRAPLRDTVIEEAALLRAANAALARGDGATALARLDEHAARFPRGALTEEREAARVLALCAAGRASESRAAASKFVSANPRSPFVPQVTRACATH